jgi:chromate reductase, NAD(P)H dehydrogenase (quinone)
MLNDELLMMTMKKKIIALCGSNRKQSLQRNYIHAFALLSKDIFDIDIYDSLDQLPHFNPDLDNETPPEKIIAFRKQLKSADGILICTPEYAMGIPGTLKNAIDWTVSSCEFSHKPTALITASSMGEKGHTALIDVLKIIEANISKETQLLISFAKTKINNDYKIINDATLNEIIHLIQSYKNKITNSIK